MLAFWSIEKAKLNEEEKLLNETTDKKGTEISYLYFMETTKLDFKN